MTFSTQLRIPGPTPLPERVARAMNRPLIDHRGPEFAVANLVSPGDEVVVALCGNFGERFAALASAYGADVVRLEFEWGQPVEPVDLERVLNNHPNAKVLLLTHNETSTGLTNPLPELARVGRDAGRIVVVDGVSSISSIAIETDAWG